MSFDNNYPSIELLRERGRRRTPAFAFEYLDNGCHSNLNMRRNTDEIREVRLQPRYVLDYPGADLKTELFGQKYDAPFGIAPIGLQGLVWPRSCEVLAEAAHEFNVPFILSTVSTASIEQVAEITHGRAWFQLYHPAQDDLRDKLLDRAREAGCPVLVLLADTPTFGYRPREISQRAGNPTAHVAAQHPPNGAAPDLVPVATQARQTRVSHSETLHPGGARHEAPRAVHERHVLRSPLTGSHPRDPRPLAR